MPGVPLGANTSAALPLDPAVPVAALECCRQGWSGTFMGSFISYPLLLFTCSQQLDQSWDLLSD